MPISLRPLNPEADFPRLAQLMNTVEPEPIMAQILHEWLISAPSDRIRWRVTAVDKQEYVVGFNDVGCDSCDISYVSPRSYV